MKGVFSDISRPSCFQDMPQDLAGTKAVGQIFYVFRKTQLGSITNLLMMKVIAIFMGQNMARALWLIFLVLIRCLRTCAVLFVKYRAQSHTCFLDLGPVCPVGLKSIQATLCLVFEITRLTSNITALTDIPNWTNKRRQEKAIVCCILWTLSVDRFHARHMLKLENLTVLFALNKMGLKYSEHAPKVLDAV